MLSSAYLTRLRSLRSYADKQALMAEMCDKENECREKFAQQRRSWVVDGVEPYHSLVSVSALEPRFTKYQEQVQTPRAIAVVFCWLCICRGPLPAWCLECCQGQG